jgi:hypothetical protein
MDFVKTNLNKVHQVKALTKDVLIIVRLLAIIMESIQHIHLASVNLNPKITCANLGSALHHQPTSASTALKPV